MSELMTSMERITLGKRRTALASGLSMAVAVELRRSVSSTKVALGRPRPKPNPFSTSVRFHRDRRSCTGNRAGARTLFGDRAPCDLLDAERENWVGAWNRCASQRLVEAGRGLLGTAETRADSGSGPRRLRLLT